MKNKGTRFERHLINEFWKRGFAAVRIAGSGVMPHPSPDIIASNGRKFLAIEVKMRSRLPLYLSEDEMRQLEEFAEVFGAEPVIAFKIPRKEWRFFHVELLVKTKKGYKIDEENYLLGLSIDDVVGKTVQLRLSNQP